MRKSSKPNKSRRTGVALEKTYQFLLWLVPTIEKFPRSQKFLLGDRLQSAALDVLEGLTEATYSRDTGPYLSRVNRRLETLRLLFRLATDLRHLDQRRYEFAARELDEIGRLVGGWMKAGNAVQRSLSRFRGPPRRLSHEGGEGGPAPPPDAVPN